MKRYRHPSLRSVPLPVVMQALSDPWRLKIVRQMIEAGDRVFTCSDVPMDVSKATRSHHFQVLREAGLIRMQPVGNACHTTLRREEFEKRFPGLLAMVASYKGKI